MAVTNRYLFGKVGNKLVSPNQTFFDLLVWVNLSKPEAMRKLRGMAQGYIRKWDIK